MSHSSHSVTALRPAAPPLPVSGLHPTVWRRVARIEQVVMHVKYLPQLFTQEPCAARFTSVRSQRMSEMFRCTLPFTDRPSLPQTMQSLLLFGRLRS